MNGDIVSYFWHVTEDRYFVKTSHLGIFTLARIGKPLTNKD